MTAPGSGSRAELLAPAGSLAALRAVVRAGADAVYLGGPKFGARAYADNPEEEELPGAVDYAHLHGVRLYLTVNTLVKERELTREMEDYLTPLYRQGLDAVIVQDLGVFSLIRERFPALPVHFSTQAGVASVWGARLTERLGSSRLILPRELSLGEIAAVRNATDQEIEVFVHVALCYCCSGSCLLSSLIGGRSGNRGRCAQPCRLPYNGRPLLSLKDLCSLDLLPEILETGADALKIEGRMRSPRWVAGVVRVYRKYLDRLAACGREGYEVEEEDRRLLAELSGRGFTDGYLRGQTGRGMMAGEKAGPRVIDEDLMRSLEEEYVCTQKQEPVCGGVRLIPGEPAAAWARKDGVSVRVQGPVVSRAENRPLTHDEVKEHFLRTGESPFFWESLDVELPGDEGAFLPVGALNQLRRDLLNRLEEEICDGYRRIH